jgi:hypothetical protein
MELTAKECRVMTIGGRVYIDRTSIFGQAAILYINGPKN